VGFSTVLLLAAAGAPTATVADLEATLAETPSATQALEGWCRTRFDPAGTVRAIKVMASSDDPTARIRDALDLGRDDRLGYRRVSLRCAGREMSLAYNWYVPARLTPEMNRLLAETDTPFGRAAAPLHFKREPIAKPWSGPEICPEGTVLAHRALLRLPDGKPLAMVVECYTQAVLAD
jgi:chorismate-pyruvate lyase